MSKPMRILVISLALFFLFIISFHQIRHFLLAEYLKTHFMDKYPVVASSPVESEQKQKKIMAVGSLVAINGVSVTPKVAGLVTKIYFKSGDPVEAGTPLVQLSDGSDQQDLINATAQEQLSLLNVQRQSQLVQRHTAAQSDLDNARATLTQNIASLNKIKLTIADKKIKAPFTGLIGIRQVNIGQYVSPGTPLVTLQQQDPLYVNFNLPEQDLPNIQTGEKIKIKTSATGEQIFIGTITAIDSTIDPDTRNFLIQGLIKNPKLELKPGLYADVEILSGKPRTSLYVPATALMSTPKGEIVYVLSDKKINSDKNETYLATEKLVTVGESDGKNTEILTGLTDKDLVVSAGQLKIYSGATVEINNSVDLDKQKVSND